jgi:hypothetical protein
MFTGANSGATLSTFSHLLLSYFVILAQCASSFLDEDALRSDLLNDVKTQESLSYNYFVAVTQRLALAWYQSLATVNKGAVG